MNKKVYLGVYLASFLLACAAIIAGLVFALTFDEQHPVMAVVRVVTGIGVLQFLVVAIIYPFVLLAKMWGSIQDENARTTPAKAIGFLFIPFFNLYWIFNVWNGFPTDYNNYVARRGLSVPQLSQGIYVVYPILVILTLVPVLGILSAAATLFVLPILAAATCDAVNKLSER